MLNCAQPSGVRKQVRSPRTQLVTPTPGEIGPEGDRGEPEPSPLPIWLSLSRPGDSKFGPANLFMQPGNSLLTELGTGRTESIGQLLVFLLGHPIRLEALRIFNTREASAVEVARELGEERKKVGNHVKSLFDHGCIERVRTEKRRGADVHFYRGALRPGITDAEWERMAPPARLRTSALILQGILAEALAALQNGQFDSRLDRHLSHGSMEVDEQGWAELVALFDETRRRSEEIAEAAAPRIGALGHGIPVFSAAFVVERAMGSKNSAVSRLALPASVLGEGRG
jgi:DNA-binding transcriptional ArsR family regulator